MLAIARDRIVRVGGLLVRECRACCQLSPWLSVTATSTVVKHGWMHLHRRLPVLAASTAVERGGTNRSPEVVSRGRTPRWATAAV